MLRYHDATKWRGGGGGGEPQGYHVEIRNADVEQWGSGPEVSHNPRITLHTVLLENLEPHTLYFVRVTPFIQEMGKPYYGNSTQEGGPFSTGRWLAFTVDVNILLRGLDMQKYRLTIWFF